MFFRSVAAIALVFKAAQAAVRRAKVQSYGANVVTYMVAKLAVDHGKTLDLDAIWEGQEVSPELVATVKRLAGLEHGVGGFLSPNAERKHWTIHSTAGLPQLFDEASATLEDWRLHPRFRRSCRTTLDELLTNALFN
ncbi:hypothetical protein B4Q13_15380, partial [Lacticaseibacillus rhamnosus]